jgi:Transposase DDE domain
MDIHDSFTWERARSFLPSQLEGLMRVTGLLSRLRGTKSAEDLCRLLLLCALPKASFSAVAEWGRQVGIASMSAPAVFFRLCDAELFLKTCFLEVLKHASSAGTSRRFGNYRLLAVDATVLCGPAATGTDQKLHVVYDLGTCTPISVDVTGSEGGETLARPEHVFKPGDLVLGDRGYGHARGLRRILEAGSRFLIRFEFASIRLLDEFGAKITPQAASARVPARGGVDFLVWLPEMDQPLRVIGDRNDKGDNVWLITNLTKEELSVEESRSLYSARWQIELFFKRLKSLLELDELPTRNGPSARPWIWAKLLLAALAVVMTDERFSPWGRAHDEFGMGEISNGALEGNAGTPGWLHAPKEEQKAA